MKKNYSKIVIVVVAICLFCVGFINYIIDPFYNYHGPMKGTKPVIYGEMYQNKGMAKYFEYDSLVTGTSMTEGFLASWFSEKFDCNAIKLPYAGGHMKDFDMLFETVFESKENVKNIFFGLDLYTLNSEPDTTRFEYPKYQISSNIFDDVEYLLNNDILANYSLKTYMVGKSPDYNFDMDNIYVWEDISTYGKDVALSNYVRPDIKIDVVEKEVTENIYLEKNLEVLCSYIENNPDTNFYVFYPPYSILYWDYMTRIKENNMQFYILEQASEKLLSYDNVQLYGFVTNKEIITNLDNYKDYTHYKQSINKYMVDCMGTDENRLTKENYKKVFEDFKNFVENYDYDSIFNE